MMHTYEFFLFIVAAFSLSWFITWLLLKNAIRISLLDIPNERSSHTVATPRGGGLSIVIVFISGVLLLVWRGFVPMRDLLVLIPPGIMVAAIGQLDDHWNLSARIRLLIHVAAVALGLVWLGDLPSLLRFHESAIASSLVYVFFLVALVWTINLNNFMDGIDGIASVEAICVAGGAAYIIWMNGGESASVYILLLLVASVLGFLVWNWPPAKIFMGDSCSGFLGLILGLLALVTSSGGSISIWSWVILYGIFIVDATYTLLSRVLRGQRFYEAHRTHAYQILARRFGSHKKVTLGVFSVNILWLFPLAVVSSKYSNNAFLCVVVAFIPLIMLAFRTGAGKVSD